MRRRAGIDKELGSRVDQSIKMVWTHGENRRVPYSKKGVEGGYGVDRG